MATPSVERAVTGVGRQGGTTGFAAGVVARAAETPGSRWRRSRNRIGSHDDGTQSQRAAALLDPKGQAHSLTRVPSPRVRLTALSVIGSPSVHRGSTTSSPGLVGPSAPPGVQRRGSAPWRACSSIGRSSPSGRRRDTGAGGTRRRRPQHTADTQYSARELFALARGARSCRRVAGTTAGGA